ncbi:gamma-glutamylcyclotransferase [Bacillus haikouensis]|uniref:gamma-glutamylcyclotransferase n=1 Tax=Bacillus haikouensis TaxID=1510468 RepID=UPI00155529B5|nr:gamma-glutamylcyclotransferase [Bacillus haikouensis]NQD66750.1 gamma-glutamylcyclotransferase [Bacillus haikouensis]
MNVFVYGTLRRHEENHSLLNEAELLYEQAWTDGTLYDTDKGYPAMKEGEGRVYGEVYKVNDALLLKLDEIEGFIEGREENLYNRQLQKVNTDQGSVEAFVYFGLGEKMFQYEISSGDWKVHQFIKEKPERILYFAYGSCMDDARFKLAEVDHHFKECLGAGTLQRYSMKYLFKVDDGGRGDIIEDGGTMEGVVYDVPQEAVKYLFAREGVAPGWYRAAFVDVSIGGKVYNDVLTFIVKTKFDEVLPPEHYAREILRGSLPHVSEAYHSRLQQQLIDLGMVEEQVKSLLKN